MSAIRVKILISKSKVGCVKSRYSLGLVKILFRLCIGYCHQTKLKITNKEDTEGRVTKTVLRVAHESITKVLVCFNWIKNFGRSIELTVCHWSNFLTTSLKVGRWEKPSSSHGELKLHQEQRIPQVEDDGLCSFSFFLCHFYRRDFSSLSF